MFKSDVLRQNIRKHFSLKRMSRAPRTTTVNVLKQSPGDVQIRSSETKYSETFFLETKPVVNAKQRLNQSILLISGKNHSFSSQFMMF